MRFATAASVASSTRASRPRCRGFDPLRGRTPAHPRDVARRDIVQVEELFEATLLAPDAATAVDGVGENRSNRGVRPAPGISMRVARPVVGSGGGDTFFGEALGDEAEAIATRVHREDAADEGGRDRVGLEAVETLPGDGL